jgi:hypothetical protein
LVPQSIAIAFQNQVFLESAVQAISMLVDQ